MPGASGVIRSQPRTADDVQRVSVEPAEASSVMILSPNWCDKTTWYCMSTKKTVTLVNSGDNLTYNADTGDEAPWVDNYHGKYSDEDILKTDEGHVPRMKVYVDGVEKTEQDPHTGTGGDYTVDYDNGSVTFLSAQSGSAVITADIFQVGGSQFCLKPKTGKKLKVVRAEVQFSDDISIKDTVKYQAYVYDPNDLPNKVPYGDPSNYKSMRDFINEADGAFPTIKGTTNPSPTWRDVTFDVHTLPWNYLSVETLKDSVGAEIRICLEHDVAFGGTFAVATFYCLSYDE